MSRKYILDDEGNPVPELDLKKWARWFEDNDRHIALSMVGPITVSTVFLGLDHSFGGDGPPVLWETCFFKSPDGKDHMRRYTSREEAEAGHAKAVRFAKTLLQQPEPTL